MPERDEAREIAGPCDVDEGDDCDFPETACAPCRRYDAIATLKDRVAALENTQQPWCDAASAARALCIARFKETANHLDAERSFASLPEQAARRIAARWIRQVINEINDYPVYVALEYEFQLRESNARYALMQALKEKPDAEVP